MAKNGDWADMLNKRNKSDIIMYCSMAKVSRVVLMSKMVMRMTIVSYPIIVRHSLKDFTLKLWIYGKKLCGAVKFRNNGCLNSQGKFSKITL